MNPWATTTAPTEELVLHPAHVTAFLSKELRKKAKEAEKATENARRRAYVVKERNYETYNHIKGKTAEGVEGGDKDDTLSSILVRAMERKTKRKEMDEAMKIKKLEDIKRKLEEEKRQCEEARRTQNEKLIEMRETFKLRVMREQRWRAKEARQAKHNRLADDFRKHKLLYNYFNRFKILVVMSRDNRDKAKNHYQVKIMRKALTQLIIHRDKEQHWRENLAANFYNVCVVHKLFNKWREDMRIRKEQLLRAEKHHRQRLLRQYLWTWRWVALDQFLQRRAHTDLATQHYQRKVLQRGIRRWRRYVQEKGTRRQQEVVATRLRFLVKGIIPDFSPSSSSSDDDDDDDDEARRRDDRWKDILSVMTV
ncbi:coiled-coil domain-containing protein 191-like [Homarus americanus]|uniref:coiled-coil domain-containing protein 191-like n=1 Tax=Homarus americanus TaxID=6706 RepID=UPI001C45C097|nr:coiled-coil domain-containing protein 191-like [Homarus americanus]